MRTFCSSTFSSLSCRIPSSSMILNMASNSVGIDLRLFFCHGPYVVVLDIGHCQTDRGEIPGHGGHDDLTDAKFLRDIHGMVRCRASEGNENKLS